MTSHELYQYYTSLKGQKSERIELMRDINSFFSPDDKVYTGVDKIGLSTIGKGELLDTTGSDLLHEFVSYALGLFFDQDRRWFTIALQGYEDNFEIKSIMEKRSDILFQCIGRTNYYAEMPMYDWDCLVHGHALMSIDSSLEQFAVCRTKNPMGVYLDQNTYGDVQTIFWDESYSYMDVIREFPSFRLKLSEMGLTNIEQHFGEVQASIQIISAYMKVDKNTMPPEFLEKFGNYKYVRRYLFETSGLTLKDKSIRVLELDRFEGFKEDVMFPVRDMRTREHAYGEGQGKVVLPKARILNKLSKDMLNLSALKANPPMMMTADLAREMGLIGSSKRVRYGFSQDTPLKPGSVYIFDREKLEEVGGRGPVQLLDVSGKLDETITLYNTVREQTAELLPVAGQVYKVARQSISEIQQRSEQQSKRLGPLRANYAQEGLSRHLRRFYSLAEKAGKFRDVQLPEGTEGNLKFVFDAFLLQTKRISDSLRLSQSLNLVSQFMLAKPSMADWLNGDKIMQSVFESNGVLKFLLDQGAVQQTRQQTQQEAQRQAALQQSSVDGGVIKSVSDAVSNYTRNTEGA